MFDYYDIMDESERERRRAAMLRRAADLEARCPWELPAWRADLAVLAASPGAAARVFVAEMTVLDRLAAAVPRVGGDEGGCTPWVSFLREVAIARQCSDRAASREVADAQRLLSVMVQTRALLTAGELSVGRARAILAETHPCDDALAAKVDADIAQRATVLPEWRIAQACRRSVLKHDPEAAALRASRASAGRGVQLQAGRDGQCIAALNGPAVPLQRWYDTLDARARALRAAGDGRTLDSLRFDLAVGGYPCATHAPADNSPTAVPAAAGPVAASSSEQDPPRGGAHPCGGRPFPWSPTPAPEPAPALASAPLPQASAPVTAAELAEAKETAAAGLRASGVEAASPDCRMSRPVQAHISVPVETLLGLSNEPGYLAGYGWIDAPASRQLLLDAELRRALVHPNTGRLLDLDSTVRR